MREIFYFRGNTGGKFVLLKDLLGLNVQRDAVVQNISKKVRQCDPIQANGSLNVEYSRFFLTIQREANIV